LCDIELLVDPTPNLGLFNAKIKNMAWDLWSEQACFFMSKQALTFQFILSKNSIEQS